MALILTLLDIAYNKEQCSEDPGWCFKAAVGNSLPSTFFSYGKGSVADPTSLPALSDMAADAGCAPAELHPAPA